MGREVLWTDVAQVGLVAAQLLVLIGAAIVAWHQVREARKLREQQNRPFVVIDFAIERGNLAFLEVTNLGDSLARNVRFAIDPPLKSTVDIPLHEFKLLNEGISTLAPGKVIRTFFDMGNRRAATDLPNTHAVQVSYTDENADRTFEEELDLDLELFMHLSSVKQDDIHDVHARLKEIRDLFRKWTWRGGGIVHVSPEQKRAEDERTIAEMEDRERRRSQPEND